MDDVVVRTVVLVVELVDVDGIVVVVIVVVVTGSDVVVVVVIGHAAVLHGSVAGTSGHVTVAAAGPIAVRIRMLDRPRHCRSIPDAATRRR